MNAFSNSWLYCKHLDDVHPVYINSMLLFLELPAHNRAIIQEFGQGTPILNSSGLNCSRNHES